MKIYFREHLVLICLFLIAMLLFAAWLFWRPYQALHEADEIGRPAASAQAAAKPDDSAQLFEEISKSVADEDVDQTQTEIGRAPIDDDTVIVASFRANNVGEVLQHAEQAAAVGNDGLARILRSRADIACHDLVYGDLLNFYNPNLLGIQELETYCKGYFSPDTEKPDYTYTGELIKMRESVARQLASLSPEASREKLLDMIVEADNPMVIESIIGALDVVSDLTQRPAFDLGQSKLSDPKLLFHTPSQNALLGRAIDAYSCYKFQGCGPRTLKSIEVCVGLGSGCNTPMGYMDYINLYFSEHERRQIEQILKTISTHETGR